MANNPPPADVGNPLLKVPQAIIAKLTRRKVERVPVACHHDFCRKTLLVKDVPYSMTQKEMNAIFSRYGEVNDIQFLLNYKTRKFTNLVLVRYEDLCTALNVLHLPQTKFKYNGGCLKVVANRCQHPRPQDLKRKNEIPVDKIFDDLNEDEPVCFINKLPTELLNYLFSFLDYKERIRIERVCVYWRYVNTKIPWAGMQGLRFDKEYNRTTKKKLSMHVFSNILKRCGSSLREISFQSCRHTLTYDFQAEIGKYCPNLEIANFYGTPIKVHATKVFATNCHKIYKINLTECANLIENDVWWLLKRLNLRYLDLSAQKILNGQSFHLLKPCLETLILNGCEFISPDAFLKVKDCIGLRNLQVDNCKRFTPDCLRTVIQALPQLDQLHLGGKFPNVTSNSFAAMMFDFKNIRRVSFQNNPKIDDTVVIETLIAQCKNIRSLNLCETAITNLTLANLNKLFELRNIDISNNNITNEGLAELLKCPHLERIGLRGIIAIRDVGCKQVLHSPALKCLDLSACHFVTDAVVTEAQSLDRAENNTLVIVAGGTAITKFINQGYLKVLKANRCPPRLRPFVTFQGLHALQPDVMEIN